MQDLKYCLHCGKELTGRSDKKYCDDYCRASHHSLQGKEHLRSYISNINKILKKNRQIMLDLCPEDKIKVQRADMIKQGFNFSYFTSIHKTEAGKYYYYCYEMGFLILSERSVLIVKNKTHSRMEALLPVGTGQQV